LKLDEREDDPINRLQRELSVNFPSESEVMEVGLMGEDPKELATIVNAVVNAYLDQTVDRIQLERRNRLAKLRDLQNKLQSSIRSDRNTLMRLAEQFGMTKDAAVAAKQQAALREYSDYRKEWMQLELLRRRAEAELKAQQQLLESLQGVEISDAEAESYLRSHAIAGQLLAEWTTTSERLTVAEANVRADTESPLTTEIEALRAEVDALAQKVQERIRGVKRAKIEEVVREKAVEAKVYAGLEKQLRADMERQSAEIEKIGGSSVELEMTQDRIDNLTEVLRRIDAEIVEVEAQLEAEPPIRLLSPATPPPAPANLSERITLTVCATLLALVGPFCCVLAWRIARRVMLLVDKL
jgi:hypothetical protein